MRGRVGEEDVLRRRITRSIISTRSEERNDKEARKHQLPAGSNAPGRGRSRQRPRRAWRQPAGRKKEAIEAAAWCHQQPAERLSGRAAVIAASPRPATGVIWRAHPALLVSAQLPDRPQRRLGDGGVGVVRPEQLGERRGGPGGELRVSAVAGEAAAEAAEEAAAAAEEGAARGALAGARRLLVGAGRGVERGQEAGGRARVGCDLPQDLAVLEHRGEGGEAVLCVCGGKR